MRKFSTKFILLTSILFLTVCYVTNAQSNRVVHLKSGDVIPIENVKTFSSSAAIFQENIFQGKSYLVFQFAGAIREDDKKNLINLGISIVDYIPDNSYVVSVPVLVNFDKVKQLNLSSIFGLRAIDKALPDLLVGKVLPHAIKQVGYADVTILTYDLLQKSNISATLAELGASIIEEYAAFKNFVVRVPIGNLKALSELPFIQWLEFIDPPNQVENLLGRSLHRVNILQDGVRNLKGDGMNIAVFDEIASQHLDFSPAGRMVNVDAGAAGSHGSHVSGTIGGKGIINPIAKGMAPNAKIYSYYGFGGDVQARMAIEIPAKTLISSNHSYHDGLGVQCGITGASAGYSLRARNTDINLNNFTYHLHCHSSGNAQSSCGSGWGTITGTGKAAKNNVVVGNITSTEGISSSSSFGPVHDGRVKPEIVGMGTNVFSTYTPLNTYSTISGTSMSTPGVTGTVALLAQYYKQANASVLPPSSLIKNIICNTAQDLGNPGPDYRFGFGRINALKAIKILEQNRYVLGNANTGTNNTISISIPAGVTKLNVMLTWNDPAAAANSSIALVNNLDLTVAEGSSTYLPWILNPTSPATNATKAVDNISNIEQVTVLNPGAGTYTLTVAGTSVPSGSNQAYSLTWDIETPYIEVLYPNGNESLTPGVAETITWDNAGVTANQVVEYSLTGSAPWVAIGTVSATTTRLAWTPPAGNTSIAKVRITSGVLTDDSDAGFKILTKVTGFAASAASCNAGEINFTWSAATNATAYDLYKLNTTTAEFDILAANITGTSYTATGLTAGQSDWYTIRAKNSSTGAVAERTNAIAATASTGGGGLPALGSISGQATVCGAPQNVSYSIAAVAGASSYSWTVPSGISIVSGQGTNAIIVNYSVSSVSGNVLVSASNGTCSTAPATLAITVGSASISQPLSGGNQSETVCPSNAIPTLTATATVASGLTLRWYDQPTGGNLVTNPILNNIGSITYYASTYDNNTMCESGVRTAVTLTINSVAAASASAAGSTTFCEGNSVIMSASNGTSYLWSNGSTTQNITVNTSGNYSCVVTNNGCTTTSNSIAVLVNPKPTATVSAGATNICAPNVATLTASPGASWLWSNGATTQSIQVNNTGAYSVRVTSTAGCQSEASSSTNVTVNPQPTVSISALPVERLLPGVTTTLTASASPTATYNYQWFKDGLAVASANNPSILVNLDKLGTYTVRVTNTGGCSSTSGALAITDSASTQLFVFPNPNNGRFDVMYYTASSDNYQLRIFDSKGAAVFTKSYPVTVGYQRMAVLMTNASAGTYMLGLFDKGGKRIASGKVIIQ